MKTLYALLLLLLATSLHARTLEVAPGGAYASLAAAAQAVQPGDTILFRAGIYPGGDYITGLAGTANAWITVMAAPGEEVVIRGGGNSWQLADAAYLRIEGFTIEGQTGNGMNLDDAGSFDTPAHHIIIERCTFGPLEATGNNDQLKMSGIDSFVVRNCVFRDGSPGGSMIDMVGCHAGTFSNNLFERAGSNCIQAKGGTAFIRIERNRFLEGGARALNIGGSTGLQFFRPLGVKYEASNIGVYANLFTGADAPIAFVGAVNSEVVNNTIWLPHRWAVRILQETTEPGFLPCGNNAFRNNIVVVDDQADNPTLNIGSNTAPETFLFTNNLWYHRTNASWSGPNLPVPETAGIIGRDPMLTAAPTDMTPLPGSPAIGAGAEVIEPRLDHRGRPYASPRSIGAIEAAIASSAPWQILPTVLGLW
jgi:hypothetical protein